MFSFTEIILRAFDVIIDDPQLTQQKTSGNEATLRMIDLSKEFFYGQVSIFHAQFQIQIIGKVFGKLYGKDYDSGMHFSSLIGSIKIDFATFLEFHEKYKLRKLLEKLEAEEPDEGGFQLQDLIITEPKYHMTC